MKGTAVKGRGQQQREGESSNKKGTAAAAAPQRLYSLIYTFMYILKRSCGCDSVV